MKSSINIASAHQRAGGPSLVRGRTGDRNGRLRSGNTAEVDAEISELVGQSTRDLRFAWHKLYRTGPPIGLSRDLLIRALANQPQERADGGASRVLRRRLQNLTAGSRKAGALLDPSIVVKTGTRLVRQWRGYTHTVLVRDDGFEYEGKHYSSLTVIAERITGAHWSGPRFFGLTKRAGAVVGAKAGR